MPRRSRPQRWRTSWNLSARAHTPLCEKKLRLVYGVMEAGSVLYLPFGWVAAYVTVGSDDDCAASGILCSCLPKAGCEESQRRIAAMLARKCAEEAWLWTLQRIIPAHEAQAPA